MLATKNMASEAGEIPEEKSVSLSNNCFFIYFLLNI